MADVPTAYTLTELKTFIHTTLGVMATHLGWTVNAGSYDDAVITALFRYGADSAADATDIRKLRAIAAVEAWRRVVGTLTIDFDFSADGGDFKRSQMLNHAMAALGLAEDEAAPYDQDTNIMVVTKMDHKHDPYSYHDEEDITL